MAAHPFYRLWRVLGRRVPKTSTDHTPRHSAPQPRVTDDLAWHGRADPAERFEEHLPWWAQRQAEEARIFGSLNVRASAAMSRSA